MENSSDPNQQNNNPVEGGEKPDLPPESVQPVSSEPVRGVGKKRLLILVVVIVVLLAGCAAAFFATKKPKSDAPATTKSRVKVGVLLALSGSSSSMGYGSMKGILLAQKQLGADNVEIVQADGKCDPKTAPSAAQYLIDQGVVAIIGENCSSASTAVLPLVNQYKVPMISPSASSPKLSIENDYFYRTVPSDIGQGSFLAASMYSQGIRKAAVFYTNEAYGSAINDVFKEKFEALGGKVVVAAYAESGVIDVGAQASAIKAAKPDGVAVVTNSTVSSIAFIKLARQAGVAVPMFGGDNLYDNTIITNGGAAAEGLRVVSFPTGTKSFKQSLLNEYQATEQLYAAPETYDAFRVVHMAIEQGATTRERMNQIIPTLTFDGASAPIKFDSYGEVPYGDYKYELLQVKDGKFIAV